MMASQCFIMDVNRVVTSTSSTSEAKPPLPVLKEKVMSYEEKTVGSTQFFKCEACPYMALAEDDIKFHLFTAHPDLSKTNGLADNIQIPCPGCTSVFDAEETLRNHLRNHHKMGIKDVKKMVKSLVQIALKDAKLKKEEIPIQLPPEPPKPDLPDMKIPQVIEIVPDIVDANSKSLPKGVAFISVDELNKMSAPNFEKVDPKDIIQEASINIVYSNEIPAQFINVSSAITSSTSANVLQVSSVTPDLISSIQPHVAAVIDKTNLSPPQVPENALTSPIPLTHQPRKLGRQLGSKSFCSDGDKDFKKKLTDPCSINNCYFRMRDNEKLVYHRKCHKNGKLQCPECLKMFLEIDSLHSHLWKAHAVDMELPTCEICGYKTVKKYRLQNIHMKSHGRIKAYSCTICQKAFKTGGQLHKHRIIHKKETEPVQCSICQIKLASHRLKAHMAAVHEKLKPFKCCHCDYTAARKEELKLHMRSHTGAKPYACDQCMYRSADHNAMRRHKKVHCKESLYQCKFCPYSCIQSTMYTSHMISNHPNVNASDIHKCPYCPFVTVSKDKYVVHLTTHTDKEGIQLLIEMTNNKNKPSWTIPSEAEKVPENDEANKEQSKDNSNDTVNTIDVEVYDCDSLNDNMPQDYSKNYTANTSNAQENEYNNQVIEDLSREDNNSDCLISESSNDTMMDRCQYTPQLPLQMTYDNNQTNLHSFLNTNISIGQNLLQNNNVNSLPTTHSPIANNISNNILSNFPIRLPLAPQISRSNITLTPVDKISIPMTSTKFTGPIILPVPSSSNSPVNISNESEGVPRKKPKISVKSNLILKGPDQENMFHSQQKMAFKRLEDNERFGLGRPVTFNNLITTQFMQLQPEPTLSESPNNIMTYPQETMCSSSTTPVSEISESSQIFSFTQQMNVSQIMLPPPQKIQNNDPSYIKLEATIKQNTQSPSLERMCNANLLNNQAINPEYKASPPLEDIHKNMNVIKNEVKSDAYYTMTLNNNAANPSIIDQYLMDNIIGEQYNGHLDLSTVVLPEEPDQQNDVIEIDDNSDDNKLPPRYDMNFPLESLYLMHNDFHFLDNDIQSNNILNEVGEMNRMVSEVPNLMNQKDIDIPSEGASNDFPNFIQGKKDPVMNTSVRPNTNKINVKNIELMKN